MPLSPLLRRFALVSLVALAGLGPGCGAEPSAPAADQLRRAFPEHAPLILDRTELFAPTASGFVLRPAEGRSAEGPAQGVLRATLPRSAGSAIRLEVGTMGAPFAIQVREQGATGELTPAADALSYPCAGGTAFWSAAEGGVEEWLLLDAGIAHAGKVVATWDIEGGALRQQGDGVEIVDELGVPRLRVTAPAAWAAGGRPVRAALQAHGATIDLRVDAGDEAVLVDPSWTAAALMTTGRTHYAAVLLPDGTVLAVGGRSTANTFPTAVERYDPLTNTWSAAGAISAGREWIRATLLGNGKVLATGGQNAASSFANADLYDPSTNTWSVTTAMPAVRSTHTQTTLNDGRALVANGNLGTAIVYDPAAATWTATGAMSVSRSQSQAVLLGNGKVLVAGGNALATAELYDPAANSWSVTGSMAQTRVFHRLTVLNDGRVLVTGGNAVIAGALLSSAELYDPAQGLWLAAPSLSTGRQEHTQTLLQNGTVLVAGGQNLASTEIYDPVAGTWAAGVPMIAARTSHTATLLPNGSVFVASGGAFLKTTEYYSQGLGSPCVTNVQCPSGFCADSVCCDVACNAGPCDACSIAAGAPTNGTCAPLPNGAACTDGDACTIGDACQAGACIAGITLTCPAPPDACHVTGVCNPATGVCSNPTVVDGTACDDGNACTQTDTCQAGVCTGANPVVCSALDPCHTVGVCAAATGVCSNPLKANGTACNDGNACTQADTCQAGVCTGANPVVCSALDPCHTVGVCAPATGVCSNPLKANGTACNDGDACTIGDTCQAGACVAGLTMGCPAPPDACHVMGVCNPATGVCSNPTAANGTACNDGNPCTQVDTCQAGVCTGASPVVCAAQDQCHTAGVCNVATGVCSNPLKPDGTACDDANPCTVSETCSAGLCGGGVPGSACVALDSCHVAGVCNPATGVCSNPLKPDGAACDDGNPCTVSETCMAGACGGGVPGSACAALDSCHVAGVCNPATGACSNPLKPDGAACDDGDACTTVDTCLAGSCGGASPVVCAALDGCHDTGVCDPATGVCSDPPKLDGTACDDGNACTKDGSCLGGSCVKGIEIPCQPSDGCHDPGVCDPATGVCSNPVKALDCSAKGPCEYDGVCDPATGECAKGSKPDGAPCPGGECVAGTCVLDPAAGSAGPTSTSGAGTGSGTGTGGSGSGTTGGSGSGAGSGTGGSGGASGTTEGCGCSTVGAPARAAWPMLLGLLALLRRRRGRALL